MAQQGIHVLRVQARHRRKKISQDVLFDICTIVSWGIAPFIMILKTVFITFTVSCSSKLMPILCGLQVYLPNLFRSFIILVFKLTDFLLITEEYLIPINDVREGRQWADILRECLRALSKKCAIRAHYEICAHYWVPAHVLKLKRRAPKLFLIFSYFLSLPFSFHAYWILFSFLLTLQLATSQFVVS